MNETYYYIERQTATILDISGFILGFEFSFQFGRQTLGYAVYNDMGAVVKNNFTTYEEAKRYCQEMEYRLE